jgi:SAM-dependent methyltransferase
VLDLLESRFCQEQQQRGRLIDAAIEDSDSGLKLRHPRIETPTYPWEWTGSQWLAAAELTLDLCEQALAEGWILKDATPLNVLFAGARPIFVDILSFERRDRHSSIWLAYGQYVRTFLLPLLMNRMLCWPLSLSLFKRDGYEPADCFAALGWRHRLTRDALWPITLPTLLDRRKPAAAPARKHPARILEPEVTANVLRRTLADLRRRTQRALPEGAASEWSKYRDTLQHYTPEQSQRKLDWVRGAIERVKPARVLDVGANTGDFSVLAASMGAEVVALERDQAAAGRLHRRAAGQDLNILTVCADLARPTPAVGWENAESVALLPRLEGCFDLVLMLAVIHHLILMEQIPLPAILALCHRLTRKALLVEWVPVEDPMYRSLMRGRDSLYGALAESDLLGACKDLFRVVDREALSNGRVLFLFEKMT